MTETARLADYVLPALTQFEKHEATFFNFEFPRNVFHLRRPIVAPPDGPLPEPEIHARLVEAAGLLTDADLAPLRAAAERGPGRVRRRLRRGDERRPAARGGRARRALPHARPDAARRRRQRGRAVGARPALRPDEPERRAPGRLRRRARRRRPAVRRHPRQPVGRRVHRRRVGRDVAAHHDVRRARPPRRSPSCSASWRRWPTRCRPATTRSGRSCCRPASGARSRPTRSCATRRGASATPTGALRIAPADAAALGLVAGDPAHLTTKRGRALVTVAVDDGDAPRPPGHPQRPRPRPPRRATAASAPASPRTSSRPARTATRGSARRGTSRCRPGSNRSPERPDRAGTIWARCVRDPRRSSRRSRCAIRAQMRWRRDVGVPAWSPWPRHGAATGSSAAATATSAGACTAPPAWCS